MGMWRIRCCMASLAGLLLLAAHLAAAAQTPINSALWKYQNLKRRRLADRVFNGVRIVDYD